MDKKHDLKIPNCGAKPDLGGQTLAVGAKQLRKAVLTGRAKFACLAKNADPAVIGPLETLCGEYGIPIHWAESMSELGHACGIEVGAAAAAALRET